MSPVPFVIFFQERSGSSFFVSVLNSHPNIYCRYEDFTTELNGVRWLHPMSGDAVENPTNQQTQKHLLWMYHRPAKASGFKFNFPFQYNAFPELLMIFLKQKSDLRVIHLDRGDRVKRLISIKHFRVLQEKAKLTSGNIVGAQPKMKITIDIPQFLDWCILDAHRRAELKCVVEQFPNRMTIRYEQLLNSPREAFDSVASFLDVEKFESIESQFVKATSDDLSEVVENYSELKLALEELHPAIGEQLL